MDEKFADMVGDNGRVNRRLLDEYLRRTPLPVFLNDFRHPFLVGKELYCGELGSGGSSHTAHFTVAKTVITRTQPIQTGTSHLAGGDGIASAIYALHKRPGSKTLANLITVGRTSDNDLCISDYSISHEHAEIVIEYGHYSVVDKGSTNGTHVNDHLLGNKYKVPLMPNDTVAFGRIVFVFVAGRTLYEALLQCPRRS